MEIIIPEVQKINDYHLMDAMEVIVQFIAVILLFIAVGISSRSLEKTSKAVELSSKAVDVAENTRKDAQHAYEKQLRQNKYAEVDKLYLEILRIKMENAEFSEPEKISGDPKYGIFAFIVWNFLETVYDTSSDNLGDDWRETSDLWSTWKGVVNVEGGKHANWLRLAENQNNFKKEFLNFVRDSGVIPNLDIRGGAV